MKLQNLLPLLAMVLATFQPSVMAEDGCPILGCCDDDCCEPGTVWVAPRCVLDTLSPGWIGHGPDYVDGCSDRSCCDADCCDPDLGTVYDPALGCCVPIDEPPTKDPCNFVHELQVFFSPAGDLIGFLYHVSDESTEQCLAGYEQVDGVFEVQSGDTGDITTINEAAVMGLEPIPTLPAGVTIPSPGFLNFGSAFGLITNINIDFAVELTCSCRPTLLPRYSFLSRLRVKFNPLYGWYGTPGAVPIPTGLGVGWQWSETLQCSGTPGPLVTIEDWNMSPNSLPPPPGAAGAVQSDMDQSQFDGLASLSITTSS